MYAPDVPIAGILPERVHRRYAQSCTYVHGRLQLAIEKQLLRNAQLPSGGSAHHSMTNVLNGSKMVTRASPADFLRPAFDNSCEWPEPTRFCHSSLEGECLLFGVPTYNTVHRR
jgi:hypothetical protein